VTAVRARRSDEIARPSRALGWMLALSAACASSSAGVNGSDREPKSTDYYPLEIGASWTYNVAYPGQQGEMTVTITGEKDGYFVDDHEGAFRHTHDGLRDKQRYLIRHPLMKGNNWKTIVSASAVEHNEILSVGEKCESAAGSFSDCLVIQSSIRRDKSMTLYLTWTFARDIGLVKLETEAELTGKGRIPQVKQSLVKYTVGKGAPAPTPPVESKSDAEGAPDSWVR
jgi:hypothetical protein